MFLCWIFENHCPGHGVLAQFSAPGVGVLHFLCVPQCGEFSLSKTSPGVCPREWSGLELTDTLLVEVFNDKNLYTQSNLAKWFSSYVKFCSGGHFSERAETTQ